MSRGGISNTCALALSDVDSIHSTGRPAKAAPRQRPTIAPTFKPRRLRWRVVVTGSPLPLLTDVEQRQDHREEQDDDGAGGGGRELVAAEGLLVGVGAEHLREVQRAAAGRHPDEGELL